MALEFTTSYLADSLTLFRYYKKLGEGAMAQATDEQLFAALDPEANSIAIVVKHIAGNMRSRWTDFLTSDGEKPGPGPGARAESAQHAASVPTMVQRPGWRWQELCAH